MSYRHLCEFHTFQIIKNYVIICEWEISTEPQFVGGGEGTKVTHVYQKISFEKAQVPKA